MRYTGLIVILLCGCHTWFAKRDTGLNQKPVDVSQFAPASTESASRVDMLGRKLLAGSPFLFDGEPTFQIIGVPEPEMFHRDSTGLFITEGMVKLCNTEKELAGVLASELGHMAAEQRRSDRLKLPDSIPSAALSKGVDGSTDLDPGRAIDAIELEKSFRKPAERRLLAGSDPKKIAENCLKDAGYDPKLLKEVEPILKQGRRNQRVAEQLGGKSDATQWLR